jgi:hypothetical protein
MATIARPRAIAAGDGAEEPRKVSWVEVRIEVDLVTAYWTAAEERD